MSWQATLTMVIGMVTIWGGLTASVVVTLRRSRARRRSTDGSTDGSADSSA